MAEKKKKHLCKLAKKDYLKENLKQFSDLVRNPKYICTKCGRVAEDKKYLCKPVEIE